MGKKEKKSKKQKPCNFSRAYIDNEANLGFDRGENTWLRVRLCHDGVFINKMYALSQPCLSVNQARRFAKKILGFCDVLDGKK